ncbi:MAG: isoprenyl transferase [Nitrospirota bacterium]
MARKQAFLPHTSEILMRKVKLSTASKFGISHTAREDEARLDESCFDEACLLSSIDKNKLPEHIAIIMDGNGRWAKERRLPRVIGHREGMKTVKTVVKLCGELGIKVLTLYAFSTENWTRPEQEINALMRLLRKYLRKEMDELIQNDVKFHFIGRLEQLPELVQQDLKWAKEKTTNNTGLILNLALNYSGRADIIDAIKKLTADIENGTCRKEEIDEVLFEKYLYTASLPEPDLLIRTSGEMRISNFLLWQIAYTEIYITPIYWPDFSRKHLLSAIIDYQKRERRFGGILK